MLNHQEMSRLLALRSEVLRSDPQFCRLRQQLNQETERCTRLGRDSARQRRLVNAHWRLMQSLFRQRGIDDASCERNKYLWF